MAPLQLAVLMLSLSAPAPKGPGEAGDWPQWRGPNRDDVSKETGLLKTWPKDGPKLLWQTDKCGVGHGSPSVAAGRIYLMGGEDADKGANEFLVCLDAKDASEIWRKPLDTAEGTYIFGYGNGPRGTPTVDGEKVYVLGAKGDLRCFAAKDGALVWGKNLVKDFGGSMEPKLSWGYSESVLIDGDRLLVTPGGPKGAVACLNKATGEPFWRSTDLKDFAGYSSIVINEVEGVKHYVQQTMDGVAGVGVDGKLLWKQGDLNYKVAVIPTPILYKNYVFVSSGYGAGCALIRLTKDGDGLKHEVVYKKNKYIVNHHGGVVRVGEHVYAYSEGGGFTCLEFTKSDTADGPKPVWQTRKEDKVEKGAVIYADGSLYLYGEESATVVKAAATPAGFKEEGRFTLPALGKLNNKKGKHWAHPVIANGKLYMRDNEMLMCFDLVGK